MSKVGGCYTSLHPAVATPVNVSDTLLYSVSTIGLTIVGTGKKKFKVKALRWVENAILGVVFTNTAFYKSTILLIFEAEFTRSMLDKLSYPESTIRPTLVGPKEKFS